MSCCGEIAKTTSGTGTIWVPLVLLGITVGMFIFTVTYNGRRKRAK